MAQSFGSSQFPSCLFRIFQKNDFEIFGPLSRNYGCASCQMGKSEKLQLGSSSRCSPCPLFLVYGDFWVNAPIPSIWGINIILSPFMISVAFYGSILWNSKLRAVCFPHFKKMMENCFSTKIKYFQSGGGIRINKECILNLSWMTVTLFLESHVLALNSKVV